MSSQGIEINFTAKAKDGCTYPCHCVVDWRMFETYLLKECARTNYRQSEDMDLVEDVISATIHY